MKKLATSNRVGVYVGTFDPFTVGHASVIRRAAGLFDKLVIGVVGDNVHKPSMSPAATRRDAIADLYADEPSIEVKIFDGLAMTFAHNEGARYIVKGVRGAADMEYESMQADLNRQLGGIETIMLPAEPALRSVSSSAVRELAHFGADVSALMPQQKGGRS